jgi:hypothetical protein
MARVKAKVVCFVDNGLRQEGDIFQYNGPFNGNLEYLDGAPVESETPEPRVDQVAVRRPGRPRKAAVVNDNG